MNLCGVLIDDQWVTAHLAEKSYTPPPHI